MFALDVFKQDQLAQNLLVPLSESTLGPPERLFGGAQTVLTRGRSRCSSAPVPRPVELALQGDDPLAVERGRMTTARSLSCHT